MRILVLGQQCDATTLVFNKLKQEFKDVTIIIENRVDRKTFLKRRIKKFGISKTVGQILFKLCIEPIVRLKGKDRKNEILEEYQLDDKITYQDSVDCYKVESVNSDECRKYMMQINPDVVVVSGTRIIGKETLESVDALFINMHTGITPKYRGVHGGYWALVENDEENCGVTVHRVDTGIDTGEIIYQRVIPVTERDNFYTYPYLQTAVGVELEIKAILDYMNGVLKERNNHLPSKLWSHPTLVEYVRNWKRGVK